MAMSMDRLHGLLQVFVLSSVKHTRQTWHEWLMWRFGSPLRLRPPSVCDGERMTCSVITSAGLPLLAITISAAFQAYQATATWAKGRL